ncbi:unnamed protein product [Caenorhabditis sp. 36 PRJEB53466]|nr:unnamed protein product [Caenorhabditis sp. 36 PRJEB53466]
MTCQVCGASESEPHFGGISCRACAAFFRRFVHSRKAAIMCKCEKRATNSHPCRQCRMQKCLEVGMDLKKVQLTRDKHSNHDGIVAKRRPQRSESPPEISLLDCRIISRETTNISSTISKWAYFEENRTKLVNFNFETLNIYQLSSFTKSDCDCISQLFQRVFPMMKDLSQKDLDKLVANVIPKWIMYECAIDYAQNRVQWEEFRKTEEHDLKIVQFFGSAIPEEKKLKDSEVLRILGPYWNAFYDVTAVEIAEHQFDRFEYSAIFVLIMFDNAYTNISEDCRKMCENIRKVILRELKAYQTDKNCEETRFFDTVDMLSVLEKAEQRFEEEILVCEMNNVKLHEDFVKVMRNCKR